MPSFVYIPLYATKNLRVLNTTKHIVIPILIRSPAQHQALLRLGWMLSDKATVNVEEEGDGGGGGGGGGGGVWGKFEDDDEANDDVVFLGGFFVCF